MSEPDDEWPCKFDESPELEGRNTSLFSSQAIKNPSDIIGHSGKDDGGFTFPVGQVVMDDDDEVTESKIRAFLDEKVLKQSLPLLAFMARNFHFLKT
jgi:mitogen-activated protein kinase kinase kinase ANP1